LDVVQRGAVDHAAFPGDPLEQPVMSKPAQRLANGRSAHAQFGGELGLGENVPGLVAHLKDPFLDLLVGALCEGLGSGLFIPTHGWPCHRHGCTCLCGYAITASAYTILGCKCIRQLPLATSS